MSERHFWLAFSLIPTIGAVRLLQLKQSFGSLSDAWQARRPELHDAGLPERSIRAIEKARPKIDIEREWRRIEKAGARLITYEDGDYPHLLRSISDAPPILYVRGSLLPTDDRALAIVGTRRATRYGHDAAFRLARDLVKHDVTIISGLAQGTDSAAHRGALAGNGRTFAVLGSGIDRIYPAENAKLAEEIIENGALMSEFALGTPPTGSNFPRRNRIISGLALGVLIAEAPLNSGALITAETALEQGRDVMAVPANIFNPMGGGCNRLIQEGARLVSSAADVLEELNIAHSRVETRIRTEAVAPESDAEQVLLNLLAADPIHIDDLIRLSGLAPDVVTATLTLLELKGLAESSASMQYCRAM